MGGQPTSTIQESNAHTVSNGIKGDFEALSAHSGAVVKGFFLYLDWWLGIYNMQLYGIVLQKKNDRNFLKEILTVSVRFRHFADGPVVPKLP